MEFSYQAINSLGQPVKGRVEAASENEALRLLKQQAVTPLSLRVEHQSAKVASRKKSAKEEEKALAIRELAILLKSGVPLAEAVASISTTHEESLIGAAFGSIHNVLRGGGTLTQGLRDCALSLPGYVVQLAAAGEMTGKLASALNSAADQMDYEGKIRGEMRNALIYPSILVVSGLSATLLVFIVVVPKFANMLKSSKAEIPALSV